MNKAAIVFSSLIRSPASWSYISRILLKELNKFDIDLRLIPKRGFLYKKDFTKDLLFEKLVHNKIDKKNSISITFDHPRFFKNMTGYIKAALLVYETFPLPDIWVENINRYLDIVFVPNDYNRNIFIKSGVDINKIRIVPYGYTPFSLMSPNKKIKNKKKRYLLIAMPHKRKGVSHFLKAFCSAFSSKDNLSLTIKSTYSPKKRGKRFPWETAPIPDIIKRVTRSFKDPPEIIYSDTIFSDNEMSSFLKSFDIYVQPSFAEGFGLVILDAMSCSIPCIVTGYGGHMDFCNKKNALLIPYKFKRRTGIAYDISMKDKKIKVAVPSKDKMIELLRFSFSSPSAMQKLSIQAKKDISHMTWENSAKILLKHLRKAEYKKT